MEVLEVTSNCPKPGHIGTVTPSFFIEAVVNMIMNEHAFCVYHGRLYGMQLLRNLKARSTLLDHVDDAAKVPISAFETRDHLRVG